MLEPSNPLLLVLLGPQGPLDLTMLCHLHWMRTSLFKLFMLQMITCNGDHSHLEALSQVLETQQQNHLSMDELVMVQQEQGLAVQNMSQAFQQSVEVQRNILHLLQQLVTLAEHFINANTSQQ
ncbi:uncharacterized protein LOC135093265 [Scylla paramamosain]|uniref:uncharacterized protein LOC135093265 n=1 Tax=Scylla paramamosain TaxID=85552 RepID=UPI0030834A6B